MLSSRLRDLYAHGEPDPVLVLLESGSLSEAVAAADVLEVIVERDRDLAQAVKTYAAEVRRTRDAIAEVQAEVARSEARAEVAADRARAAKADLEREQARASKVRAGRQELLAGVREDREEFEAETKGLEKRSAALAAEIRKAQGLPPVPSGSVAVGPPSPPGSCGRCTAPSPRASAPAGAGCTRGSTSRAAAARPSPRRPPAR